MFVAALCTMGAMATDYKGRLAVDVNGVSNSQEANITILAETDTTYTLQLKNFIMVQGEMKIGVGNIELNQIKATKEFGFTTLKVDQSVLITEGDDPTIALWMGPMLGEVPLVLNASFNDAFLSVNIDIDMQETLEQIIKVNFVGTDPNASSQPGVPGDITGDGSVDINDINKIINIMLGKQ